MNTCPNGFQSHVTCGCKQSLHDKIMRAEPPKDLVQQYEEQSGHSAAVYYKLGHRDARLDAAELAYAQDALVAQLVEALRFYGSSCDASESTPCGYEGNLCCKVARAALAAAKEQQ